MSSRCRRVLMAISAVLWLVWGLAFWAGCNYHLGAGHQTATMAAMLSAGMTTIAWILGVVVAPIAETARVWFEIGRRDCQCQREPARVIPLRAVKD